MTYLQYIEYQKHRAINKQLKKPHDLKEYYQWNDLISGLQYLYLNIARDTNILGKISNLDVL